MALAHCGLTMSDDELVSRVRAGDDEAFERLYGRYCQRVGGFVAGMVGDAGRSEDVTQEVFVSALRRLRATDRPVVFKPWVYEIARNAAIDEFRRTRRQRETPVQHGDDGERGGLEALPGGAPGPDRAAETRETLGTLTSALGGLTETHRRVLVLRELEGRTYEEIATATGLTVPAVESALFRARRRLATEYEELSSGRRCAAVRGSVDGGGAIRGRAREALRRHLSHCQGCRRHAALAGFDLADLGLVDRGKLRALPRRAAGRLGALVPLPAVLWLRRGAELAAGSGDQAAGWGKAVAATVVVLAAGGAGVVAHRDAADNVQRPAVAQTVAEPAGERAARVPRRTAGTSTGQRRDAVRADGQGASARAGERPVARGTTPTRDAGRPAGPASSPIGTPAPAPDGGGGAPAPAPAVAAPEPAAVTESVGQTPAQEATGSASGSATGVLGTLVAGDAAPPTGAPAKAPEAVPAAPVQQLPRALADETATGVAAALATG